MSEQNCGNCYYYRKCKSDSKGEQLSTGDCRKQPPTVDLSLNKWNIFPRVTEEIWCGSWAPKYGEIK